jgi:hypothetical protein
MRCPPPFRVGNFLSMYFCDLLSASQRIHTECTDTMSAKLSSLRKRLATLEQQRADRARREELADCNCPGMKSTVPFLAPIFPEALEDALNKTCPVHGLRRFGPMVILNFVNPDGTPSETTIKMHQLIRSYRLRLSQHLQSGVEPAEDD